LEKTGLIADMIAAVEMIAAGRLGFETDGNEHEGMVTFSKGIEAAMALYEESMNSGDCELMIAAEYTYLSHELEYAENNESGAEASAAAAIQAFDDALLSLKAVEDPCLYKGAELTFPHRKNWRYKGCPNDAFQVACTGHKTRIKNGLSRFGVNRRDRALAEFRIKMFNVAQNVYLGKQRTILSK
jgi:hypothetical protein